MIASVLITATMIAPTKNPSSRLKMVPHASQLSLTWNKRAKIRDRPQAGQRSSKHHSSDFETGGRLRFNDSAY